MAGVQVLPMRHLTFSAAKTVELNAKTTARLAIKRKNAIFFIFFLRMCKVYPFSPPTIFLASLLTSFLVSSLTYADDFA
jgi:hypothetical protein